MFFKRQVTFENLRLLDRIYRQSVHHQVRQRAHCIILRHQGMSVPQLLEIFPVSRKTLYNWFESWDSGSIAGLYNRPGRGRKATFDPDQKSQIQAWVKAHPRQLKTVLEKIKSEWDITVSVKTVKRVLKALKMSWHRFRKAVAGQPNGQEYAEKKAQLRLLQQLDANGEIDLYYLDESGFCLSPCVPSGWQMIGETLEIPARRSKRLNVLGLMKRDNQFHSYVSEQSVTSEVVIACIDEFFAAPEKRTVIVVDKAPIHTSGAIQECLEGWKQRNIELFQLPSYSAQLNLIEILWRFIKYEWLEVSAYRNWQSLVEAVERILRGFGEECVINFV